MQWIPRCPTWGSNAIHIFSAKRIPSSPSWLRRCSVCSTGDSVLRPLILKLGLSENAGVPKPLGLKLETSFPPWNLGHAHFQIDPLHILLIRYIPYIYIYICICQCIWICRCRCIHIYIYICRCTCICICIFVSYEGWLPTNKPLYSSSLKPANRGRRPTPTRPWSRSSRSCEWQTQWQGRPIWSFHKLAGGYLMVTCH